MAKRVIVFLLLVTMVGITGCFNDGAKITLRQGTVNRLVGKFFPFKTSYSLALITIENPEVSFLADRIGVDCDFSVSFLGESITGNCAISTALSYNRKENSFYIVDFKLEDITFISLPGGEIPKKNDPDLKDYKEEFNRVISEEVSTYFSIQPVYVLESENKAEKMINRVLEKIEFDEKKVVIYLQEEKL